METKMNMNARKRCGEAKGPWLDRSRGRYPSMIFFLYSIQNVEENRMYKQINRKNNYGK